MKQHTNRFLASVLALALLLSMAACSGGGNTTAATMHLRRAEGTVTVSDSNGKDVPVLENLGLYSGYGVNTRAASYAWIDLDDVKLTKLDQNSEISIRKEGKALDIEVISGSLFFNVTQPLEDDETMNIRASTMLVGIRGTSGWVENRGSTSRVYLLEGKVECSAGEQTVRVNAGEYAELTEDGELTVQEFADEDIPVFVQNEVNPDLPGGPVETPGPGNSADLGIPPVSNTPEPVEEVTWSYDGGVLNISGTGPMDDYGDGGVIFADLLPWYSFREDVHTVIIDSGVTSIGAYAFSYCSNLTSVSIPNSVTSIGDAAFMHCDSLSSVAIPGGVTNIGGEAFRDCSRLASVAIPNGVTSIEYGTFMYCTSLASVTMPGNVTGIGQIVFLGCDNLANVYYGGSESRWNQIDIDESNSYYLLNATIHYNSAGETPGPDGSEGPEISDAPGTSAPVGGEGTTYYEPADANELSDVLQGAQDGDIVMLTGDFSVENVSISGGSERNPVILDLNGYTLTLTGDSDLNVYGALCICDSSVTGSGALELSSRAVRAASSAYLFLDGGTVNAEGNAVYLDKRATFTMNGGTINSNNQYDRSEPYDTSAYGYAVYANHSTFIMNGGSVNGTDGSGNAARVFSSATLIMEGGSINGLVYAQESASVTMNGGTINGRINCWSSSSFTINGGEAISDGGTVMVQSGTRLGLNGGIITSSGDRCAVQVVQASPNVTMGGTVIRTKGQVFFEAVDSNSGNSAKSWMPQGYTANGPDADGYYYLVEE